jgi:GH35 family endo-1,4-beta-xylanase
MRVHWLVNAILLVCRFTLLLRGQTLRQAADEDGSLPATAVRSAQLSEPAYASALAREFNTVEAEGAMKWWVLRPNQATD